MVIRIHGHHLLFGLRLNNYHNNHLSLYPRQIESVKSEKWIVIELSHFAYPGKINSLVIVVLNSDVISKAKDSAGDFCP